MDKLTLTASSSIGPQNQFKLQLAVTYVAVLATDTIASTLEG